MNMNSAKLFVIVIAALAAMFAVSAFQTQTQKFGVVDLSEVADKSKLGAREKKEFDALRQKYTQLLQFINANKAMTGQELDKLRQLWGAEKPTPEQTKELEALKTKIQGNSDELRRLLSLLNPTPQEQQKYKDLAQLAQQTEDILPQLDQLYGTAMQAQAANKQQAVIDKARAAVNKLGQRDGYTVIFENTTAPYGANNVTDAALKIMDTDNP